MVVFSLLLLSSFIDINDLLMYYIIYNYFIMCKFLNYKYIEFKLL